MGVEQHKKKKHFFLSKIARRFLRTEAAGGVLMMLSAALAIVIANSGFSDIYQQLLHTPFTVSYANRIISFSIQHFIQDVLMVIFFLLVGLELKREAKEGFLAQKEQIILPLVAAVGGMLFPAIIFTAINYSFPENLKGWAIPSATDIAFALGVLSLLGRNIPHSLKIFLLAIAIFDDIGAILIIAIFYSTDINMLAFTFALAGVLVLFALNRLKITVLTPYILTGVYLWFCLHYSGIHTTIAGVLVGVSVPMRTKQNDASSPVNKAIHFLHPWVAFAILPVFALSSAGVNLSGVSFSDILNPLPMGIAASLFWGKQIGILLASVIIVRSGISKLPENTTWLHIYAISIIAGIGFTMSLFIGMLAFPEHLQDQVKIGVMAGSLLSSAFGIIILKLIPYLVKKHPNGYSG